MPTAWRLLEDEVNEYLSELQDERNASPLTIRDYRYAIKTLMQGLHDAKRNSNPRKVTKEDIIFLKEEFMTGSPRYRKDQLVRLMIFLKWAGNLEAKKWKFNWGNTERVNVRWLEPHQIADVKMEAIGIEKMMLHCELDLGMRRIELQRLQINSFQFGIRNTAMIHGKGRNGGKYRTIPTHPQTRELLNEYLEIRSNEIIKARKKNPSVNVPNELFIHEQKGQLIRYSKTGIDRIISNLGKRSGFKLSNHDLRRTFGRTAYYAGLKLEEIMTLLGHSDTKTTIQYLGLDHTDLDASMKKLASFQEGIIAQKWAILENASSVSGQQGIAENFPIWVEPQNALIRANRPRGNQK